MIAQPSYGELLYGLLESSSNRNKWKVLAVRIRGQRPGAKSQPSPAPSSFLPEQKQEMWVLTGSTCGLRVEDL